MKGDPPIGDKWDILGRPTMSRVSHFSRVLTLESDPGVAAGLLSTSPVTDGPKEQVAPIFLVADDDREALDRLLALLNGQWFYIPVREARHVVGYAKQFATTAVLLSDGIRYPDGGSARLLQHLLDQVGKPVVIMSELWDPEVQAKWKRMGAADCIPHPTRLEGRMDVLFAKIQDLAAGAITKECDADPCGSQ